MKTEEERHDLAYPLQWPAGYTRTPSHQRDRSRFKQSLGSAIKELLNEVRRLGGQYVVISSSLKIRLDGLPYAGQGDGDRFTDPGAALYFTLRNKGKWEQHAIACDLWDRVRDNVYAIAKTIEAMRGMERWGCSEILQRTMQAFAALPPAATDWRTVLELGQGDVSLDEAKTAYRRQATEHHPDRGGSLEAMFKVNEAWEHAQRELAQ